MANKGRRGRGEGNVYQREDGLWVGRVSLGYGQDGKRRRRVVYGRTKAEALEKLRQLQTLADQGNLLPPDKQTLADYLTRWLEDTARPTIRKNTYRCYEGIIRTHINPHIGGTALARLTADQVAGLYAAMERAGASPRLRQLAHAVLRRALKIALRRGRVAKNVCDAVEPPRVAKKEMQAFTPAEVEALLAAAAGHRLEALFTLAVGSGLREGELFGLHWTDLDLGAGLVVVRRQLEEVNGKLDLTEPKSAKGRRCVDLPAVAVAALHEHRKRMLAEGHLAGPVFCDTQGGYLRKSNFIRTVFKPILKKAGLRDVRFHDLRHTNATLLLAQGVHAKVVQERLGHSQISLTLDTYSHVLPALQKEAAAKLDGVLGKKISGPGKGPEAGPGGPPAGVAGA